MAVYKADKTLAAIEAVMAADQGASFRVALGKVLPHMKDAYQPASKNPFRNHMGASMIGKECPRAIWYSWHWFTKPNFIPRMLRLFNRGHLEEARFIAMLLIIGVQVYQQDEKGNQYKIKHAGGHFGGSGDGIAIGLPDLEKLLACLLEFKTHSGKYFAKLIEEGVRYAKPEHYTQMQVYMRKMGLTIGLYAAVNKDTDEIWMEFIYLDTMHADQYLDRAVQLIDMRRPPKKLNESPGYWICKFCDHKGVCHDNKEPERNCRTCYHSVAEEDGTWRCQESIMPGIEYRALSEDEQLAGCQHYLKI